MSNWIYSAGALDKPSRENNANIVIAFLRDKGYNDTTIASILGNMQAESSINPHREEVGGEGYGLVQWTPKSVLINHCNSLAISPYTNGDIQLQCFNEEMGKPNGLNEWYTTEPFISPYYPSGATSKMINVTANEFIKNTKKFSLDEQTILFMVGYLRPNYSPTVNHIETRKKFAREWAQYMKITPPIPPDPPKQKHGVIFKYIKKRGII